LFKVHILVILESPVLQPQHQELFEEVVVQPAKYTTWPPSWRIEYGQKRSDRNVVSMVIAVPVTITLFWPPSFCPSSVLWVFFVDLGGQWWVGAGRCWTRTLINFREFHLPCRFVLIVSACFCSFFGLSSPVVVGDSRKNHDCPATATVNTVGIFASQVHHQRGMPVRASLWPLKFRVKQELASSNVRHLDNGARGAGRDRPLLIRRRIEEPDVLIHF